MLTATAITYACLDYLAREVDGSKTVSLNRLASDPGSPGRIFKVTEDDIAAAVEESAAGVGHLRLARPAGSRQLAISAPRAMWRSNCSPHALHNGALSCRRSPSLH